MKSISDQYKMLKEGKIGQNVFLRNTRMFFPKLVNNLTKFEDAVLILKNKGMLVENESYSPTEYNLGMRYELKTCLDTEKANKIVLKNLKEDNAYYSKLHLSGYNKDAMKKSKKKRIDLPTEVKKDNFVDNDNKTKYVKIDNIQEIKNLIKKNIKRR
jgi:hypothetical protein